MYLITPWLAGTLTPPEKANNDRACSRGEAVWRAHGGERRHTHCPFRRIFCAARPECGRQNDDVKNPRWPDETHFRQRSRVWVRFDDATARSPQSHGVCAGFSVSV